MVRSLAPRLARIAAVMALAVVGCNRGDSAKISTQPTKASVAAKTEASDATKAGSSEGDSASDSQPSTLDEPAGQKPAQDQHAAAPTKEESNKAGPVRIESKRRQRQEAPAAPLELTDAPAEMPKVLLSDAHGKLCLVGVGDAMPEMNLTDLDGTEHALQDLRGERLTVVLFWTTSHPYAMEELADLGPEIKDLFSEQGVQVVAINEHDTAETAQQAIEKADADYPQLLDPQGQAFAKVGTKKLPRTYLLDADGKIVWFDIEYSRSTRRDLLQAIRFLLGGGSQPSDAQLAPGV